MIFVIVSDLNYQIRLKIHTEYLTIKIVSFIFIQKLYLEARFLIGFSHSIKSVIQLIAFIAAWHTCMSR